MSKLYKKYLSLKSSDKNTLYLFQSGIFYIFLDDDAKLMSQFLNLKLTNLNSTIQKCGFPINSFEKYFSKLKSSNYNVNIITNDELNLNINNYKNHENAKHIITKLINSNIEHLSISEAFDFLYELQNNFKFIYEENYEEKK